MKRLDSPSLNTLQDLNRIIRVKYGVVRLFECGCEAEELGEGVGKFIRAIVVHPCQQSDEQRLVVSLKILSVWIRHQYHRSESKKDGTNSSERKEEGRSYSRRNIRQKALQQLKSPNIIQLTREQPLNHNPSYRIQLSRIFHRLNVFNKERLEKTNKPWYRSLLLPESWSCEEWKKGGVCLWERRGTSRSGGTKFE